MLPQNLWNYSVLSRCFSTKSATLPKAALLPLFWTSLNHLGFPHKQYGPFKSHFLQLIIILNNSHPADPSSNINQCWQDNKIWNEWWEEPRHPVLSVCHSSLWMSSSLLTHIMQCCVMSEPDTVSPNVSFHLRAPLNRHYGAVFN